MKTGISIHAGILAAIMISLTACAQPVKTAYIPSNADLSEQNKKNADSILSILQNIHEGVMNDDLSVILPHVNQKKGLFVDLKAHKTYGEIQDQISDKNSYLNTFYLDTALLRKNTGDSEQLSLKEILSGQNTISVEFFFNEKNDECELKLTLQKRKNENYRLNNPYFIKINGVWYIYRLF